TCCGLFYERHRTAAEVRNIVLSGPWPQALETSELADLLVPDDAPAAREVSHAREAMIGADSLADSAQAVWEKAQQLAPPQRLEFLTRWVLPSERHASFRLQSAFVSMPVMAMEPPRDRRVAPALALVTTAAELGKLDELSAAIAEAAREYPDDPRSVAAL